MKINYKKIEKLKSFKDVKLRGDETFDELLEIEKQVKWVNSKDNPNYWFRKEEEKKNKKINILKGVTICKSKNCDAPLYKNQSQINPQYCWECV